MLLYWHFSCPLTDRMVEGALKWHQDLFLPSQTSLPPSTHPIKHLWQQKGKLIHTNHILSLFIICFLNCIAIFNLVTHNFCTVHALLFNSITLTHFSKLQGSLFVSSMSSGGNGTNSESTQAMRDITNSLNIVNLSEQVWSWCLSFLWDVFPHFHLVPSCLLSLLNQICFL